MTRHWTFGQRIGAGFAVTVVLAVAIGGIAVYALRTVVASKDRVINVNAQLLVGAQEIRFFGEEKAGEARGFLLTRDERFCHRYAGRAVTVRASRGAAPAKRSHRREQAPIRNDRAR